MGNKQSDPLDDITVDRQQTEEARAKAREHGLEDADNIIVRVQPPVPIVMEEALSDGYLAEFNHQDTTQEIRIKVDQVEKDVRLALEHIAERGGSLDDISNKTQELMDSSRELYLSTASCTARFWERLRWGCISCQPAYRCPPAGTPNKS